MGEGNSPNSRIGWDRRFSMPGALKLDHLQSIKPILPWNFSKFSKFSIFILGSNFLLPQRANNGKVEFTQTQNWMPDFGSANFVLKIFYLPHLHYWGAISFQRDNNGKVEFTQLFTFFIRVMKNLKKGWINCSKVIKSFNPPNLCSPAGGRGRIELITRLLVACILPVFALCRKVVTRSDTERREQEITLKWVIRTLFRLFPSFWRWHAFEYDGRAADDIGNWRTEAKAAAAAWTSLAE